MRGEGERHQSVSCSLCSVMCPGSRDQTYPRATTCHLLRCAHSHTQTDIRVSCSRTRPWRSWLMSSMDLQVEVVILLLGEVLAALGAGAAALVLAVRAPHVAVVRRVRGEGFATVLALEGLLPRVLADVGAQDAGCCECLQGQGSSERTRSCRWFAFTGAIPTFS